MIQMPIIKERDKRKSPQAGEAGFTLVEMIIVLVLTSILSVFVFQIFTKCLKAQISMQERKERSDDAVLVQEKISREIMEAVAVSVGTKRLRLQKNVTSNADTNLFVEYWLNQSTLRRQSAASAAGVPGNISSNSGNIVAENVESFVVWAGPWYAGSSVNVVTITLAFEDGSNWMIATQPRNYGL